MNSEPVHRRLLIACIKTHQLTVLEITVGHFDQFQHLTDQNPGKFTVHFQWDGN